MLSMAEYQVTLLGRDGRVRKIQTLSCDSDDDAIDAVGWSNHPERMEIWLSNRLIASFPALPATLQTST